MTPPRRAPVPRRVNCLGAVARRTLAESNQGRVLAAGSKAVYLLSATDRLIWLATEQAPMHRRAMRVASPLPAPRPGSVYQVTDRELRLDDGFVFVWGGARAWRPLPSGSAARLSRAGLARRLAGIRSYAGESPAPRGFGVLIAAEAVTDYIADDGSHSPALRRALPSIRAMRAAWHAGDRRETLACAEDLLGLGEGLTPSGDDFVGAFLFTASSLDGVGGGPGFSPSAVRRFLARARGRTNLISYTLLHDHAVGHASESLHRVLRALLRGDSIAVVSRLAKDLIRIGHTTGWDSLTGLWMALAPAGRAHRSRVVSPGPSLA